MVKFTLKKAERLKSKKLIEQLYIEGNSLKVYPLKMMYLQRQHTSNFAAQVGVSVPKRNFKKAVDRNRIKRLLRETYRKHKPTVYENLEKPHIFMISYLAKEELTYDFINKKMDELLSTFINQVKQ